MGGSGREGLDPSAAPLDLIDYFRLALLLVTRLADSIGTGTRDQNFDALVEELTSQFARCQQLLNSISGTISSKSTFEIDILLGVFNCILSVRELITKYRSSVEDLLKGDTR
ncbi:mediator of RNA polymerase II transcription subunit 9-like [Panicum miliaceum]|uniref:Mediator of RNA polymerase II transcription subunit 9-like n=1 Tax=Panicum miliaceum TaxID=4540 RepID=A0A3L6TUP0_PANMI|nr:mediator of RNA polymerase II transcription subunit 9-like [Panicum miliaceum]